MNRAQIERAERIAERLANREKPKRRRKPSQRAVLAAAEADTWKRPNSISTQGPRVPKAYEFTEAQLRIAERSLMANG